MQKNKMSLKKKTPWTPKQLLVKIVLPYKIALFTKSGITLLLMIFFFFRGRSVLLWVTTWKTLSQKCCISLNRYFVLDFETGILQYFVNEQSKTQKPRGALSLAGAIISPSDEVPHMLVVYSASGEIFKLRGTVLLKVPAVLFSLSCLCISSHLSITSLYCRKVVVV